MSLKHSVSLNNIKQTSSGQMKSSQSSNGSLTTGNGKNSVDKERLRKEREHLKLWIHPITTIKYFGYECVTLFQLYKKKWVILLIEQFSFQFEPFLKRGLQNRNRKILWKFKNWNNRKSKFTKRFKFETTGYFVIIPD
jgi:hypothetical protein